MAEENSREIDEELEKIKKLRPEDRIKKIREFEEKIKREKDEIEKLLEQSIVELKKEEKIKEIKVPEPERVDVEKLFREERSSELERKAAEAKEIEGKKQVQYKINIEEAENIYSNIKGLGITDTWQEDEFKEFYRVKSWLESIDTNLLNDEVAESIMASKNLVKAIGNYLR